MGGWWGHRPEALRGEATGRARPRAGECGSADRKQGGDQALPRGLDEDSASEEGGRSEPPGQPADQTEA